MGRSAWHGLCSLRSRESVCGHRRCDRVMSTDTLAMGAELAARGKRAGIKNVAVVLVAVLLASLGIYNIVLKATWTLLDDGVFWKDNPEGVVAARVAAGGPGAVEGLRAGDLLIALDGEEV